MKLFVGHSPKLYSQEFVVYNVHCLLHLVKDAEMYGPLDRFSSFPFESYLYQLKRLL